MNLLLDLGHSRLKWSTLDGEHLGQVVALDHHAADFHQQLRSQLDPSGIGAVWLASVVSPALRDQVIAQLPPGLPALRSLGPPAPDARLQLAYRDPATFGVDRWLCLRAACDRASLVVGCGTALTIDLVDDAGRHHGGLIAASPTLARQALLQRAVHLPAEAGSVNDFADNTADAISTGTLLSAIALIERQARAAASRLGAAPRLLLTGGGAATLSPLLQLPHELRPLLLFEGMREMLRR